MPPLLKQTASKKIEALIRLIRFLFPEVAHYLCKFIIQPCMEYYCHVQAGAPICYLDMLDKLQKRVCSTVVPTLADSLEPLVHFDNVAG